MSGLVEQLLVTALALWVPVTVALFLGEPRRPRLRGAYRTLLAAGLVAGGALALGAVAGAGAWRSLVVAGVLGALVVVLGPASRPWTLRGLLAWSLTIAAGTAYLLDALGRAGSGPGIADLVGGAAMSLLALVVVVLALALAWEIVDVLARWDWPRRAELERGAHDAVGRRHGSFVSLHLPIHGQSPDMVVETLDRLVALQYDDFEVLVVDHGTADPEVWRPVERYCRSHEKLGFFHLEGSPVPTSAPLSFALDKVDPRTRVVGVVGVDDHVDPDFLWRCVPLLDDEDVAFVRTRLDHRGWETDPYFRRLHAGTVEDTLGLVRLDALVAVGGWDAWCVTEDAELALRLLRAGWSGTSVDRAFGTSLVPPTFEGLERQWFRRCFGGVQLLRLHWRSLLPGRRTASNRLTFGQRWAHLAGGLQWFADLAAVLLTVFLLVGALDAVAGDGSAARRLWEPLPLGLAGLVVHSWLRPLARARRTPGLGWRATMGALGLRLAVGWVVATASVRALVARRPASLRPRKTWATTAETLLALLCLVGALTAFGAAAAGTADGLVVGALLLVLGAGYAAAPLNARAAAHANLTPELRRRRESPASSIPVASGERRRGVGPVLAAGIATAAVVLVLGSVDAPSDDVADDEDHPAAARPAAPLTTGPVPSQSLRTPLSPLSPLLSAATTVVAPTADPTLQPVAEATPPGPVASGATLPSTTVTTTAPSAQPTPVKAHGRPTALPSKPTPTRKPR